MDPFVAAMIGYIIGVTLVMSLWALHDHWEDK